MSTVTDLESYQQFALQQQAANNAWSAEQAQKQMDFQKQMSDTAHQREVADLKAAGLNPVLSANSGASVPNGSMAEGDRSAAANVGNILQQVLQAQSAREVAGMYNAATLAAASMAANASMYGADMSYQDHEDHPTSLESVYARMLLGAFGSSSADGKSGVRPSGSNGSGKGVAQQAGAYIVDNAKDAFNYLVTGISNAAQNKSLFKNVFRPVKNNLTFSVWASRNGYSIGRMSKATYTLLKGLYNSIGPSSSAFLKAMKNYRL